MFLALLFASLMAGVVLSPPIGVEARDATPAPIGEHPRLPSEPNLNTDLMYEQGAPSGGTRTADEARLLDVGKALYATHCSSCHGSDLRGTKNVPPLENAGGAAVDFFVTTGRMPDVRQSGQAIHTAPHFTVEQIAAIDAFVSSRGTSHVPIPNVVLDRRLLQRGAQIFQENCEGCHGVAAEGASAGRGWIALPLYRSTPTEVGEAIRIGPGVMPRFSAAQLSPTDVDAVATYVRYLTLTPGTYGGATMDYLGPAAEGLVGGILGVGALFWVIFFTGTKADGTRLHIR